MNQGQDFTSAVMQRERSRSRVRLVTITVGAASLAAAGVVAYNLPGPAHTTAVSKITPTTPKITPTTPAAQPSPSQRSGDDGEGDGGTVTTPSGSSGQAPAQATSGGS
jgi:hypothetical protein